jgi:alkaline phosphatase D
MATITRRSFIEMAVALGATAAWGQPTAARSKVDWHERRDFYPEGVASGDPQSDSVLLWTRRPPIDGNGVEKLTVEIAEDESFRQVVGTAEGQIEALESLLVSVYRPSRQRQSRRTDHHRTHR